MGKGFSNSLGTAIHHARALVSHGSQKCRKIRDIRIQNIISPKDVWEVPKLAMQAFVAWTLPEAAWSPLSRFLARSDLALHPTQTRSKVEQIGKMLAGKTASDCYRVAVQNRANLYDERFQYLRAWRPGGWNPSLEVVGTEHVSAAIAKGRGIIFWGGLFSFNNLVAKMAMHRLGLEVVAFSIHLHGISGSLFGVRYLNRVYRDIENRYLQERLMVRWPEIPHAVQRMRDWIKANGAVYFAVGGRGRRTAAAPFLGYRIILATGPLALAESTGAALLPIHTFRAAPRHFQVTIGSPIEIHKDKDGNVDCTAAVEAYADALTPFVLRDLGQWHGWDLMYPQPPWGDKKSLPAS
jgi:lauroyl/myristoyl acyltransferase